VVVPSNPIQAKGLLLASIRDPDPVVFFEPKAIYRASVAEVPDKDYEIPLGVAEIVQQGTDITLLGWGAQMVQVNRAAELAAADGISCEVIDLRTLLPWDRDTLDESVSKTGRLLISHEAPLTGGFAGEIAASIQELCFLSLEAPISRVTGLDTPFPLIQEKLYLPDHLKIYQAIVANLNY
jgi:2-oxoisovalerate dehydrogenase E1 component beta subunit